MKYYLIQIKEKVYPMKLGDYNNNEISPLIYERGEFSDDFQFIPYCRDIKYKLDIYREPNTSMLVVSKRLKELLITFKIPLISFLDFRFLEGEESKHAPRDKFTPVKEPYYFIAVKQYPIEKLNIDYRNSVFEYNTWEVESSWTFYPVSFENFDSMFAFNNNKEKVQSLLPRKLGFKNNSNIPDLLRLNPVFIFSGLDKFIISERLKEEIEKLKIKGISRFLEIGYGD